ncbi:helix-turn-helix transcriptional regulator [Stieleria varia]|uniref:Helix-turn-helix domain protein n=1 Tax=Stieleria varia TaxID=2528005 RepID=A0A5C6AUM0_9BACT|nr:helix-turn-helix transcriptional regulator [Stieleria varia]TWU02899.1 Helix-turn-helix domain protein [Stieleria varia]
MSGRQHANLVEYITHKGAYNQADLARELGVSRAQISKWKSGEHIPSERRDRLLKIAGLFDTVSDRWAMFAETEDNSKAWCDFFEELLEDLEWGGSLRDLSRNMPDIFYGHLIEALLGLDAKISVKAPASKWEDEESCKMTPLANCLFSVYETWGQLYDWIDSSLEFDDLMDGAEYELFDVIEELRWSASGIAIDNVEPELLISIGCEESKIKELTKQSRQEAAQRLSQVCNIRIKHGLPITADYFQLLTLPPIELAEASWFQRKGNSHHPGEAIKSFLSYGERQLLSHQECQAAMLRQIDSKLDRLLELSK